VRSVRRSVTGVLATAMVAIGCTGSTGDGDVSVKTEPAVRLVSTGGDVFAWEQRIEGSGACDDVVALVDGADVDVEVETTGGGFTFVVPVTSGEQTVSARCASGEEAVETQPIVLTGRLEPRPTARIEVNVRGGAVVLDGSRSEPFEVDGAAIERFTWTRAIQIGHRPEEPAPMLPDGARFDRARGERLTLRAPSEDGEYYVTLEVADAEGRTDTATTYFVVEDGQARAVDLMHEHPAWIDRSIVYAPVHQLWGGGANAVEERLPYLKDLGVDALWLWPPVTRRAFGEEYAIADYFTLDEEWGTPEEFRSMVDRAHELGLRVLLDFVPNHSSIEHRYYRTAERDGPGSHYWDFYDRKPSGEFTHYFDWEHLPNLNYDEPQVRRMITEAFSFWIREFDVDGFRVDAAWGIKRRRPDYWLEWRREVKRIKPDLFLLAEATARDPYYFERGFDVGYDWTNHPGRWPWASFWEFPQEIQALSMPALTHRYPDDALVLRFLNNNDTDIRFEERYGADFTRVASAMQFTVPGIPLLFGGDEIGASYQPYGSLEEIPWTDDAGLRPWYDGLIALRERFPALLSAKIDVLTSNWGSVVSYVRPAAPGGTPLLVLLNFGEDATPTFQRDPAFAPFLGVPLEDALTGRRVSLDLTKPVEVPARSVRILVPAGAAS
jgi:cyclomaltodextrinase / maltogenic alpha-amylase / neopullulanase